VISVTWGLTFKTTFQWCGRGKRNWTESGFMLVRNQLIQTFITYDFKEITQWKRKGEQKLSVQDRLAELVWQRCPCVILYFFDQTGKGFRLQIKCRGFLEKFKIPSSSKFYRTVLLMFLGLELALYKWSRRRISNPRWASGGKKAYRGLNPMPTMNPLLVSYTFIFALTCWSKVLSPYPEARFSIYSFCHPLKHKK
jgi:hypothetical protein